MKIQTKPHIQNGSIRQRFEYERIDKHGKITVHTDELGMYKDGTSVLTMDFFGGDRKLPEEHLAFFCRCYGATLGKFKKLDE